MFCPNCGDAIGADDEHLCYKALDVILIPSYSVRVVHFTGEPLYIYKPHRGKGMTTYKEAVNKVLDDKTTDRLMHNQEVLVSFGMLTVVAPERVTADDIENAANHYGDMALIFRMIVEEMRK